ncbi:MAG TPA: hypothetical protein P5511_10170 [Candidatus Goldiibacteriota bacterium]|nr:hypothetical protein [Candidatus Goldiibacteriota bacterium]
MKKTTLALAAAVMAAFIQGCSLKHGIGYVNDEIALRVYLDEVDVKLEASLGIGVRNDFDDTSYDIGIFYRSQETGSVRAVAPLGLAAYYTFYKGDFFDLSAGLKYRKYFGAAYSYLYYFEKYPDTKKYYYEENLDIVYAADNKASLVFPDIELKCPFMENLKFTASLELLYVRWTNKGGNYFYRFVQSVKTNEGYSEETDEVFNDPGPADSVQVGSGLFAPAELKIGIIYYF